LTTVMARMDTQVNYPMHNRVFNPYCTKTTARAQAA